MNSVTVAKHAEPQLRGGELKIGESSLNTSLVDEVKRIQKNIYDMKSGNNNAKRTINRPPEHVLQAFNTWAFKREQPDTAESLLSQLKQAMSVGRPIRFVLYWGKGPRHSIGEPEWACLEYLGSLTQRIQACYAPGTEFILVFTDTHARLNGHAEVDMNSYFAEVGEAADKLGFSTCRLSHLLAEFDPNDRHVFHGDLRLDPIFDKLMKCAAKWYRGGDCPEGGAEHYFRMNLQEKRVIEIAFPDGIFVTFNGSDFRTLFPETLPVFFMYSIKRGCSVKPWFMPASLADDRDGDRHSPQIETMPNQG